MKGMSDKEIDNFNKSLNDLQDALDKRRDAEAGVVPLDQQDDGIQLDVDTEELDYIDDLELDNSMVEGGQGHEGGNNSGGSRDDEQEVPSQHRAKQPKQKQLTPGSAPQVILPQDLSDEQLAKHPCVKNLFNQFWEEKMNEMSRNKSSINLGKNQEKIQECITEIRSPPAVKSPSDTTIYAPAMNKAIGLNANASRGLVVNNHNLQGDDMINPLVSDFVEMVRLEQDERREIFQEKERRRASIPDPNPGLQEVQEKSCNAVIEGEKFRATSANPGMSHEVEVMPSINGKALHEAMVNVNVGQNTVPMLSSNIPDIGKGVSDDDFFHLTCHIDPNLIHRVEKGEFVELEKLLSKEKFYKNDERLEWVQRDGGTFLVPAQKENKIGSFRRWEQAFRAYAAIYCGANPHRSKEIWQYISVINTAANSYVWENVYNYDITFRHLMAFNLQRSWAVCYNQMWNLSMKEPIPKNSNNSSRGGFNHLPNNSNNGQKPANGHRKKSDYCWNFNKGVPCKFGNRCKFIERSNYCDSPAHGVHACPKIKKKQEAGNSGSSSGVNTNKQ